MIFRDSIAASGAHRALHALLFCGATALAGCGLPDGAGTLMVDPGHYSAYHCDEIPARWKELTKKERDLRGLMAKADTGGGGTVIGTLAYRGDYESVLTEEKLLLRTAAEKNCNFSPNYQSDETIR
jgi:hypothetical protein